MLYKVYWNNVCLLNKAEKEYLIKTTESKGLESSFTFEYYGLGFPQTMSQKIEKECMNERYGGDFIVSTDVEVFQNPKYRSYFECGYQKLSNRRIASWVPDTIHHPSDLFLPFIIIPLVMVVNTEKLTDGFCPTSLKDLLSERFRNNYAYGGENNSAGQSLVQAVGYLYGEAAALSFIHHAQVTAMPAQAFQKVIKGDVAVAIVPSIFALRTGIRHLVAIWPSEGAVAIPSYAAVHKRVPESVADAFFNYYLNVHFQNHLMCLGDIIPTHRDATLSPFAEKHQARLIYPDWRFYESFRYHNLKNGIGT